MCVIFITKQWGNHYYWQALVFLSVFLKILLLSAYYRAKQIAKCCQMQLLI